MSASVCFLRLPHSGRVTGKPSLAVLWKSSPRFRRNSEHGLSIYDLVMAADLHFDDFAEFIREYWAVPARKEIAPETKFERDLGLTEDDGNDLLVATEKRFGVALSSDETGVRETFNLGPNEFLFHSEGVELYRSTAHSVRQFTVEFAIPAWPTLII